jgi:hypothetical protein
MARTSGGTHIKSISHPKIIIVSLWIFGSLADWYIVMLLQCFTEYGTFTKYIIVCRKCIILMVQISHHKFYVHMSSSSNSSHVYLLLVTCFQHYWCCWCNVLCKFLILWAIILDLLGNHLDVLPVFSCLD